jgi:hypothetical protein
VGALRTLGIARGYVIARFQRLDLGRFLVYAHSQKLLGNPTPNGVEHE